MEGGANLVVGRLRLKKKRECEREEKEGGTRERV
jgi:hypothetical protein